MELVKQQIKDAGYAYLRLNVNRQNAKAIKSYKKNSFETIQTVNNDIGNGFFMNDYVMETEL
jgi:ribosomal protein S18 acetylase RimI-like enzyme